jgi:hypothetical protein
MASLMERMLKTGSTGNLSGVLSESIIFDDSL